MFLGYTEPLRASVAQGIEHRSPKAGVVRSNRLWGTMSNRVGPFGPARFVFDETMGAELAGYRQKSVSISDIQPLFRTRMTTF